jgi:hypothetical protein
MSSSPAETRALTLAGAEAVASKYVVYARELA